MPKTIAILLAACCFVAIPIVLASDSPIKGGLVFIAVLGAIGFYSLDKRRESHAQAAARAAADTRLQALLRQREEPEFQLAVHGSRGLRLASLVLLLALALLFVAVVVGRAISLWISALAFLAPAVFLILAMWPARNKPVIVMSRTEFETPWTGAIPWHAVEGIDLREINVRTVRFHALIFEIPSLQTYHPQFSRFQRMIYTFRPASWGPRFEVRLQQTSEHPEVVFKLARALWTDATCRTRTWDSSLDDARRFPRMTRWLRRLLYIAVAFSLVSMLVRCFH